MTRTTDLVLFACTGLSTPGLASRIGTELQVPVVDALLAAGLVASYAARGLASGAERMTEAVP